MATPIGNLEDLSPRAADRLQHVDLIAAEDTRRSKVLMQQYGITTPMIAYHEHNESRLAPQLVKRMLTGESIALISDAGTPLISDPGFRLVRAAQDKAIPVVPLAGASAVTAALSVSGLPPDRFVFEGFLPARANSRRARLAQLAAESRTMIFVEAPHRLPASLKDMVAAFGGDREAALARELTKRFETVMRSSLTELAKRVAADESQQKGEVVVLVGGQAAAEAQTDEDLRVMRILLEHMPLKSAVELAVRLTGRSRNMWYRLGVAQQQKRSDEPD